MKKTKSQNEELIPADDSGNPNENGRDTKIVKIDVFIDWENESIVDLLVTSSACDPDWQLDDVADDLMFKGYKVLWCAHRSQFHLIVAEGQEKEAYLEIEKSLREACGYQRHGALIKYEKRQGTPTCYEEGCELTELYLPALKKRLIKLVDRQNKKRQKAQEITWVDLNPLIIKCLMLRGCNPN